MNGCPCDDASDTYFLSPSHNTKQYFRQEGRYVGNMCCQCLTQEKLKCRVQQERSCLKFPPHHHFIMMWFLNFGHVRYPLPVISIQTCFKSCHTACIWLVSSTVGCHHHIACRTYFEMQTSFNFENCKVSTIFLRWFAFVTKVLHLQLVASALCTLYLQNNLKRVCS